VLADDAKKLMPPKNKVTGELERISKEDSEILKTWINEGAKWPDDATLTARKKETKGGDESALVAQAFARIAEVSKEKTAEEMKPYAMEIPGTDVTYEMVPIPGGKFKMGSPEARRAASPTKARSTR